MFWEGCRALVPRAVHALPAPVAACAAPGVGAVTGAGHGLGPGAPSTALNAAHPRQGCGWAAKLKEKLVFIWESCMGRLGWGCPVHPALRPKAPTARLH